MGETSMNETSMNETSMNETSMNEIILHRKSQRSFTGEELKEELIQKIQDEIIEINAESALEIEFVEDGSRAFSHFGKSYGLFKNVRSLLLLKGNPGQAHFREKIGYYGEKLLLFAESLGLATCWVGGTFDRESFSYPEEDHVQAVILLGYPAESGWKGKILHSLLPAKKKPWEARIEGDMPYPKWVREGMEAAALAPSALNKQKPVFHYHSRILTATVENRDEMDMVDLGIAKCHFDAGVGCGHFVFGNGGEFAPEV